MTEREFANDVVARLQAAGFATLFAGGCVRDELLGLLPADYDIATAATPEQVKLHFRRCHSFGASFGVVEVLGPRDEQGEWLKVQVATFRSDGVYTDGRRPDAVTFSSPEEDAARRDFTVNGMFLDPIAGRVIDYVGGQADLTAMRLRAIGDPHLRFAEDKLRLLRAVRMAARFKLTVDPETLAAGIAMADQIAVVSQERIAEELRKMLANPHRLRGITLAHDFGLLPYILPGVPTVEEKWERLKRTINALPMQASFELSLAVLLHGWSAKPTLELCRRLRLSNQEIERITWLVEFGSALRDAPALVKSKLYPILIRPGIDELLTLHRAAAIAGDESVAHVDFCERLLLELPAERLNPPPLLTGDDLAALGLRPGPQFKRLLDAVRTAQLDETIHTRADAEALVRSLQHLAG